MKKQLITVAASVGILFTAYSSQASAHEVNYKVQSGDTLWKIGTTNNISVQELQTWNNLNSNTIYVGQELTLIAPHTHVSYNTYTVQSGDTLYLISQKYNTTVSELKSINNLPSDIINVRQVLKVPNAPAAPIANEQASPSTKTYIVKSGDTLWSIATKNGLTVNELKSYNDLTSNNINIGQELKLSSDRTNISNADALIAEGMEYIGVPYVWGGSNPKGFDCSGFLNYTFGKVGISIPRTVETIWAATTSVSTPHKGDIVFYTTYKAGPSHAGIYVGDNKFLHAGTSTGVTITDMNNPYWKARYLGAKKVNL